MYQNIFGGQLRALLFLVVLIPFSAASQHEKIYDLVDSLKDKIAGATGEDLFRLHYQIGYELFDVDNQQAVIYSEKAYQLSKNLNDSLRTRAARTYGQLLRRVDRLDDAIVVFREALDIAVSNNFIDEQKKILNALAISYNLKAMYDRALETNFRSLEIREQEGDKAETSIALASIAFVYLKMGDFDQALSFYMRSADLKSQSESTTGFSPLYINIALCHVHLGDYESAKEYVNKAFSSCDPCDDRVVLEGEFCLGMSYTSVEEYDKAKAHFGKSSALSLKLNDNRFLSENYLNIGTLELARHQYDSAIHYLAEAEKIALASGYNQMLIHTYKRFSRVYSETKEYEKAAAYQSRYILLKDSIYSEELIRNLARAQTNYEERENIKTIAEKNQILVLNEQIIQRQREVYFFVGLVAVLSILGTFMFLRYSRALSKAKQELSVMNQTLEKRVEDRTKQLQNVNNELDNFIYKTSHDIRGPLASLKGIANVALLELKDEKAQDYLQKLDASADKLNSILTRLLIVNQINHAVLNPIKINFQELINEILVFEKKKGIPPRMTITHDIDPDVLLITDRHVLRIILENLIDNAIKYHNSSERIEPFVKIKTSLSPQGVLISVIDNGIGIQERDPQKLFQMFVRASERSESGGIGLYLTKLASERLYARVDFSTTPEKYTCFTVTIPENLSKVLQQREKEEHEMR